MLATLWLLLLATPQAKKPVRMPRAAPTLIREAEWVDDRVRVQERAEIELQWAADVVLPDQTRRHGDYTTRSWYAVEYVDTVERLDASGHPAHIVREYLSAKRGGEPAPDGPQLIRERLPAWAYEPDFRLPPHTVIQIYRSGRGVRATLLRGDTSKGDLQMLENVLAPSDAAFFPSQPVSVGDRWTLQWEHPERLFGLSGTAILKGSLREIVTAGPRSSAKADVEVRVDAKGSSELPVAVTLDLQGAARSATRLHRPLALYLRGPVKIEGTGVSELPQRFGSVQYTLKATGTLTFRRTYTWLAVGGKPTGNK